MPFCEGCCVDIRAAEKQRQQLQQQQRFQQRKDEAPADGVSITTASLADLSRLQELWSVRGGQGQVLAAWKVDNPLRTHLFMKRRETLRSLLGRQPDSLEG